MFRKNKIILISFLCLGITVLLKLAIPNRITPQPEAIRHLPKLTVPNETRMKEQITDLTTQLLQEGMKQAELKALVGELLQANHSVVAANFSLMILIEHLLKTKPICLDPKAINFEKDEMITGEYIFFNLRNNVDCQNLCDKNGYMFPHLIKENLKIGVFIHASESLAYIYYPPQKAAFRCRIQRIIPQQKIVILEW